MTPPNRANGELVMMTFLRSLPDIPGQQVATVLSERSPDFAENGFVLVQSIGGAPDENGMQTSVLAVETYAYNERRAQLPWARAANLWTAIKAALPRRPGWLTLPGDYGTVLVRDVSVLEDPRRLPTTITRGDPPRPEHYARYGGDVQITWTQGGLTG